MASFVLIDLANFHIMVLSQFPKNTLGSDESELFDRISECPPHDIILIN
jgi:hypothetical protein